MELSDKQKIRKICYSKITIAILLIFVVSMIPSVYGMYQKVVESSKDRSSVEREFADLQKRENMLSKKLEMGKTDRGMEQQIREKFNVAKEGESVIVLVDKPVPASTTQSEASVIKSMWNKIKKAF